VSDIFISERCFKVSAVPPVDRRVEWNRIRFSIKLDVSFTESPYPI
jgi:hypothetical protein